MNTGIKLAAAAFVALTAHSAMAQEAPGGDCESSPAGCGNPNPPPSKPALPDGLDYGGSFRLNGIDGYIYSHNDTPYVTTFAGGAGNPLGQSLHSYSDGGLNITVQATDSPGAVSATASNHGSQGFAFSELDQGQTILIHTSSAAQARALYNSQSLAALATIDGYYTLSASGYGYSTGEVSTGFDFDSDHEHILFSACDPSGQYQGGSAAGCVRTDYSLAAYFELGSSFENGSASDLIGVFGLSSFAEAGRAGLGSFDGDASAYVDPTVNFSLLVQNSPGVTTSVGTAPMATQAAVPEPEAWALMLAGFGGIGTAMRRQKSRDAMAKARGASAMVG